MGWGIEALDAELATWRAEREAHARARHARAEREAERRTLGKRGRSGGCRRCRSALEGRARLCRVCGLAEYWRRRTTVRPLAERAASCAKQEWEGYCRKCGVVEIWPRLCGARQVCESCAGRFYSRAQRRLTAALGARLDSAARAWQRGGRQARQRPAIAMLTLALRHSGDVSADRAALSSAWNRWRTWYAKRYQRKLAYCWVPEITDGTKGDGHVHLHVAAILPYRDYRELLTAWKRATGGQAQRIHVRSELRTPKSAARYVAKYACKGAKTLKTPQLAANWVRAQHARRAVSASRSFWVVDGVCAHERAARDNARAMWEAQAWCRSSSYKVGKGSASDSRAPP